MISIRMEETLPLIVSRLVCEVDWSIIQLPIQICYNQQLRQIKRKQIKKATSFYIIELPPASSNQYPINIRAQNMALNLTEDKLVVCLENKQRYKGVNPYIQQACKFNEPIYTVINAALLHTLLGKQSKCMTRLLALRFFKQLLLTANFTMIDSLDEKIEDSVLEIAQYNSKTKQARGAHYFIDTYKAKQDEQTERLGISYVILATEIIGVLSKIYPTDQNGEETRFVTYYKRLTKLGISVDFNKCNYFKKEDVDAFSKNYQKWIQWCEANYQEEEEQQELKDQKSKGQPAIAQSAGVQKAQQKQEMINLKDINLLKSKPSSRQNVAANALNVNQAETINQSVVGPFADLNFTATNEMNLQMNPMKEKPSVEDKNALQNDINTYKRGVQTLQKEKQEMQQKHKDQLKQIKDKNEQYIRQIQSLKGQLSTSTQTVSKLQAQLKQRQTQLKNESDSQPQRSKRDKNIIENECYNIIISPPTNIDILEQENDLLKQALEQCEKSNNHSQQRLKNDNDKLLNLLKQKQQQIESLKNQPQRNLEKQIIQHLINEDSLVITEEIKVGSISNHAQQQRLKPQQNNKVIPHDRREISQQKQPVHERPRSLKKTESQRRINKNINYPVNVTNTSVEFYSKQANLNTTKLQKTAQQFCRGIQQNPKFITTFPYLDNYFPKLPEQCCKFKNYCLQVSDLSTKTFYENKSIKASIKMVDFQRHVITILNKDKTQRNIKLIPSNESIILHGQKTKKIANYATAQFQITTNNINLNLRFPAVNVSVGHSGVSVATSSPQIYQIPLPITLLNYCSFQKMSQPYRHFQSRTLKYITNRFVLNKDYKSIRDCFMFLDFSYESRDLVYRGLVEFNSLQNAKLILQLREYNGEVTITTQFEQFSSNACNLAKVLIQVLMYLTKSD